MRSSLEIAQAARLLPISVIAESVGLEPAEFESYGRDKAKVELSVLDPRRRIERVTAAGLGDLPICMAKTHLSLSDDPGKLNAPAGFRIRVRDLRRYTGAGWLLALCGDMQTMPGLGPRPAAFEIDIDADGRTVGHF